MTQPSETHAITLGGGCFWCLEAVYLQVRGVLSVESGYSNGQLSRPSYEAVCSGQTGHNEVVLVVFDPKAISYDALLKAFFESHDPTQGMRQGNDIGTQYRSGIYTFSPAQMAQALAAKTAYSQALAARGFGPVTTEIREAPEFYYAEDYHQQYLSKNPGGYCGLGGTGVSCTIGLGV